MKKIKNKTKTESNFHWYCKFVIVKRIPSRDFHCYCCNIYERNKFLALLSRRSFEKKLKLNYTNQYEFSFVSVERSEKKLTLIYLPAYYRFDIESVRHGNVLIGIGEFAVQYRHHSYANMLTNLSMRSNHFCHASLVHFRQCLVVKAMHDRRHYCQMFYCHAHSVD